MNESTDTKLRFSSRQRIAVTLGMKKPIENLIVSSALERCLVLCDQTLLVLNSNTLQTVSSNQSRLKGVSLFCLNENPKSNDPFELEVCAVRKKKFSLYIFKNDQFNLKKELSPTNSIPTAVAMDGNFLCAGMTTHYAIYNTETGGSQVIFGKESGKENSIVKRVGNEEFLVMGPGRLGVFVQASGASERPPLPWQDDVLSTCYSHPFVLALTPKSVLVFSITDYQLKEKLPIFNGKGVGNFDGIILAFSKRAVLQLSSIPWDKQVKALIDNERFEEAIDFAKNSYHSKLSKEQFDSELRRILVEVAFKHFINSDFDRAKDLFIEGAADARDVISIFPNLDIAHKSSFSTEDLRSARRALGSCDFLSQALVFLKDYLLHLKQHCIDSGAKQSIDTALILVFVQLDDLTSLVKLLNNSKFVADTSKCIPFLERKSKYVSGLLYWNAGYENEAFDIWMQNILDEYTDLLWPGFEFLVEKLSYINDMSVFWKNIGTFLKNMPETGLCILKSRCEISDLIEAPKLSLETAVDFLQQYPSLLLDFLEYVVFEKKSQTEKFHTQLGLLLADTLIKDENNGIVKEKFLNLLKNSKVIKHKVILGRIECTTLNIEKAIVYSRLNDFEKSFKILVTQLSQHDLAISLCISTDDKKSRENALYELLRTYLYTQADNVITDLFDKHARNLLSQYGHEFDVFKVLEILPSNWTLKDVQNLCVSGARSALSDSKKRSVERMLLEYQILRINDDLAKLQSEQFNIDRLFCKVCKRQIFSSGFARFPNGTICHVSCMIRKNICPVTGEVFSFKS
ncbi:hypothetical protein QYM36_003810 [Artemia franciscana]|nr:hypothetical protein QYM36_003810 [Artemia franciscana]